MNRYTHLYCGLVTATFCEMVRGIAQAPIDNLGALFGEFFAFWLISSLVFKFVIPRVEGSHNNKKVVIILVVLLIFIPLFIFSGNMAAIK